MSGDDVNKISKFAIVINIELRVASSRGLLSHYCWFDNWLPSSATCGRDVDAMSSPASNRVTDRRGPCHAVSSINPRCVVHFRFRRESRLTRKIRLDRARRDHPVGWRDGMVYGASRGARWFGTGAWVLKLSDSLDKVWQTCPTASVSVMTRCHNECTHLHLCSLIQVLYCVVL